MQRGQIKPVIDRTCSLADLPDAMRDLEAVECAAKSSLHHVRSCANCSRLDLHNFNVPQAQRFRPQSRTFDLTRPNCTHERLVLTQ